MYLFPPAPSTLDLKEWLFIGPFFPLFGDVNLPVLYLFSLISPLPF